MLRIFSRIAASRCMSPSAEHSGVLQTPFFHTKPMDEPSLSNTQLKRAYALEQAGEEIRAQEIYKAMIEATPEFEKAYQGLWNSWQRTCGFKLNDPLKFF